MATHHDPDAPAQRPRTAALDWGRAGTIALGVGGGLLLSALLGATVTRLRGLLVLLLVSLFLSFAMEPAVQWLHQRGMRRGFGTFLVFLLAGLLALVFVVALAALVGRQLSNLVTGSPALLDDLAERAAGLPDPFGSQAAEVLRVQAAALPDRIGDIAAALGRGAVGIGTTLVGGVLDVLTLLLVTFYLVADGPRLRRALSGRLAPENQRELLLIWELAIAKTGGYVYSRLLTAAASAVVHVIAFQLLGLPYGAVLGIWVGLVSSLVPVVGTYVAGALPITIALAVDPLLAVWVALVLGTYQQIENYLVAPRITQATLELHPALAFLSVLVGAALLGAPGALLALPVAAIIAALVSTWGERHEVLHHGLTADAPPTRVGRHDGVEWLDPTSDVPAPPGAPEQAPPDTHTGPDVRTPATPGPHAGTARGPRVPAAPQAAGSTTTNVEP